jgi:hypothetical protein
VNPQLGAKSIGTAEITWETGAILGAAHMPPATEQRVRWQYCNQTGRSYTNSGEGG